MQLQLSKHQIRSLSGLGSGIDVQRMKALFLDIGAGKQIDEAICPHCEQTFVRRTVDRGRYCCTECEQKHAAAIARAEFEAGAARLKTETAWRPVNHLSR